MTYDRYAIYVTAPPGSFADKGAAWLGWDIANGQSVDQPKLGPDLDLQAVTATPRRYGLHGTFKPPFHLAVGKSADELTTAARALCQQQKAVTLEELSVSRLGGFVALTPVGDTEPLAALAAKVVRELDGLRAQPSAAELERRRAANLTPSQDAALVRWGYPYVLENFKFHMTLSGRFPRKDAERIAEAAQNWFHGTIPAPLCISELALCGQQPDGRFIKIERLPLQG